MHMDCRGGYQKTTALHNSNSGVNSLGGVDIYISPFCYPYTELFSGLPMN